MKKIVLILICITFAAGYVFCGNVFAQRGINNSQDAANAAKASLSNRPNNSSSQIEWLNNVINVVNMKEPVSKETSAKKDKSDTTNQ